MSPSIRSLLTQNNNQLTLCETHDHSSTAAIRNTAGDHGQTFDGLWYSGLTQSTYLGLPDTELISPLQRAAMLALSGTLQQPKTRPLCAAFDADSGGDAAEIPALVAVLALVGVSMIIIEDKAISAPGQKINSLSGASGSQDQADMHDFANIIRAFKAAANNDSHRHVMITARIETFTVRKIQSDGAEEQASQKAALAEALKRAEVYYEAGVDAIMIHSKSKDPNEVLSFLTSYRATDPLTPLVVVPTAYAETKKSILYAAGANIIIYANHLMRAKISAVGTVTDKVVAEIPSLFSDDAELKASLDARNFGSLLRRLWDRKVWGEESREAQVYRIMAATYAAENMKAAVKELVEGDLSGCEADGRIIPVKDLLKINARQVSSVEELAG